MADWFHKQNRFIQVLLLFIPIINWIIEVGVRFSTFFKTKKVHSLLMGIIAIFGVGVILGWIDIFFTLFTKHLFLE